MPRFWMGRALAGRRGSVADASAVAELECSCGHTIEEQRSTLYQAIVCDECGEHLFLLPLDVYPHPRSRQPANKSVRGKSKKVSGTDTADSKNQEPAVTDAIRVTGRRRLKFTRFRLLVLGLLSIVSLTVWWIRYNHLQEQAAITLRSAGESGYAALADQDFATAERELARAVKAIDVLGKDDVDTRRIRQMWQESSAAANLTTESLFELLDDAEQFHNANDPVDAKWNTEFDVHYAGRWLVMDTRVELTFDADGETSFEIDFPLMVNGRQVVIVGNLPAFEKLTSTDESQRVIFSGQLQSCRLTDSAHKECIITLNPDTAFLWSSLDNYRALGFDPEGEDPRDPVSKVLQRQSALLEVEP